MAAVNIAEIFAALDKLEATAGQVVGKLSNPREKQLLGAAVDKLKELRAAAGAIVPAQVQQLRAEADQTLAEAQQAHDRALARVQAAAAAPAPAVPPVPVSHAPPAPPAPAADPALGGQLRDELLAMLGVAAGGAKTPAAGKDVWEDWK